MEKVLGVLVLAAVALCGCPGGDAPTSCAAGEARCGSACCGAGQACSASSQCVAGVRFGLYAEGLQGATGTVSGAGVTCGGDAWQGCWTYVPAGETVSLTAAAGAGSTFIGYTAADAVTGNTATATVTAQRGVHAWFGPTGTAPTCPTMSTHSCVHGTFDGGGITRPLTLSGGLLLDANQLPCTFIAGYKVTGTNWECTDSYLCGTGPYAMEVTLRDVGWGTGAGWTISSPTVNWSSALLCDGVCTASNQCGANQVCTSGSCVARPSGGGGTACTQCLDACRGLPGCCTGTGCICDSDC
jgi:hypothetical protein